MVITREIFVDILKKFADSYDDVLETRGEVVCCINSETISLRLHEKDGSLYCQEADGPLIAARNWIVKRLAKLDQLANRILCTIEEDDHFIPVPAIYIPSDLDDNANSEYPQAAEAIYDRLKQESDYQTLAVYLLSEAGDGKTWVMNHLARFVAQKYIDKECDFLFLPISLEGRPFLRLDDLVIGALANKYRFRDYYYEAVVALVKLGVIVLGLDGFEEIIVEGREEKVISSLTELLKKLNSKGKVVVSARKAFYDYATRKQIGLLDALREYDVAFPAFRLKQWQSSEFKREMGTFGFTEIESEQTYARLVDTLSQDHPILVRPVLARKFIEMLSDDVYSGIADTGLLSSIDATHDSQAVIANFVKVLISREAKYKWFVTSGPEKGTPLLSIADHYFFLETLAEEMWCSSREMVDEEFLQEWMGVVCDLRRISPALATDCRLKIIQHAMLSGENANYSFCHEAFRKYFLGRQIANYICDGDPSEYQLVKILEGNVLDPQVIASVVFRVLEICKDKGVDVCSLCEQMLDLGKSYSRTSALGENVGAIVISSLSEMGSHRGLKLSNLHISEDSICGKVLSDIHFNGCVFDRISTDPQKTMSNVVFENCRISTLVLSGGMSFDNVCIDDTSMPSCIEIREAGVFDPGKVRSTLAKYGWSLLQNVEEEAQGEYEEDRLTAFLKISRMFYKATAVARKTMRIKFGGHWGICESEYLPDFISQKLLFEVKWAGSGVDARYKLGVKQKIIQEAYSRCNGVFSEFVSLCHKLDRF